MFKASQPVLEFGKKHGILTTSYCGLVPLTRHTGGPVDPVLASIRERLVKDTGKEVTEGQVLGLWLRYQGIPQITSVDAAAWYSAHAASMLTYQISQDELKAGAGQRIRCHGESARPHA